MKTHLPTFAPYQSFTERAWFFTLRGMNVLTLLFLMLPVLVIIPLSFADSTFLSYPMPGVSLRWYHSLFESEDWIRATKNSFIVAPAATAIATVLGTLAAVGLNKAEFRGKAMVMALLISPMVVPVVVVGVGVYIFFAQIGLSETYAGLILAHAALGAP